MENFDYLLSGDYPGYLSSDRSYGEYYINYFNYIIQGQEPIMQLFTYFVQTANRRTSHVFAFDMQIPDQVKCLVLLASWNQIQDLSVAMLFVRYRYSNM